MTCLPPPEHTMHQTMLDLADQNKQLLAAIVQELSKNVSDLERQLSALPAQSSVRFNSTKHEDITRQIAKSGLSIMRICAALDIDYTAAVDSWILEQESALFAQQDLML